MNNLLFCSGIIIILMGGAIGGYLDIKKNVKYPAIFWGIGALSGGIGVFLFHLSLAG